MLQEADQVTATEAGHGRGQATVDSRQGRGWGEERGNGLSLGEGGAPSVELAPGSTSSSRTDAPVKKKRYKNLDE
jgi:hypothetical protein